MIRLFLSILIAFSSLFAWAGEGMWLPFLLKQLNESEMQGMGMKMSAEDIYSVNKGSLKDAIVHFGGFCTAEVISDRGLILTNWHCGRGSIQSHTSLENNYLRDGFWAMDRSEELHNPGLTATFIVRMEDVTKQVLGKIDPSLSVSERQSQIDRNINKVIAACKKESWEEAVVKPFFKGNQYILIVTETYRDVRLVGTPPQMVGEFGKDTDNWVWPRHTGDFSLFRIYAGPNNRPADFSPNNKPFKPKHSLPVSLDGVEEGDFTLVFGFPGSTDQYLPASAVEQIVYKRNPARIAIRDKALNVMDREMRKDEEVKIQYTSKFSSLSNSWKRWKGEMLGLRRTRGLEQIRSMEAEFTQKVNSRSDWKRKWGDLLPDLNEKYAELEPYVITRDYYSEITGRNIEIFRAANMAYRLISAYNENGEAGFEQMKERLSGWFDRFYKDYRPEIDQQVFEELMNMYMSDLQPEFVSPMVNEKAGASAATPAGNINQVTDYVFNQTYLLSKETFYGVMERGPEMAVQSLSNDMAIDLVRDMLETYNEKVAPRFNELQTEIYELEKEYMKALMEVFPDKTFYPDANSTMRVTYGKVDGYKARDAIHFEPNTTLEGVFEKYVPGDYEFDVPEKLLDLYQAKDYGPYGQNGQMPVCFVGTNHTTGGNSGSPAIDAHGNLVGLNFDRAWEGVMSDYYYDSSICRNIMVDVRYILFIIDKYAGAGHLVKEMKLVHPKK